MDFYSNYFEADSLIKDKTATEVIQVLKRHFARHGIPNRLVSDNGPFFNSYEFLHFAKSYDMSLLTKQGQSTKLNQDSEESPEEV